MDLEFPVRTYHGVQMDYVQESWLESTSCIGEIINLANSRPSAVELRSRREQNRSICSRTSERLMILEARAVFAQMPLPDPFMRIGYNF
jgi:hypothetical protein